MKIYYPAGDWTPDLLDQRQTCYHLSQRGELVSTILSVVFSYKMLNSCPTQDRVEGWDAMKPLYCRSVNSKGAGRPHPTHHHKSWWNEMKRNGWVCRNSGMKFVARENGRNTEINLPRLRCVHQETHMEWPRHEPGTTAVGSERITAYTTRPPVIFS